MTISEKIVNIETGEITWRNYTAAEIAEVEEARTKAQQEEVLQAEVAAKRAAAEAKLAALGLMADDLAALGF